LIKPYNFKLDITSHSNILRIECVQGDINYGGIGNLIQPIRGVTFYFKRDADLSMCNDAKLDKLKADGVNFIWLAFKFNAPTQTGNTMVPLVTTATVQAAYNKIVAKGFKIGFKPHVMWNSSAARYNPASPATFIANYRTYFFQYLAMGSVWDYISITNELEIVTRSNLTEWSSLITAIRASSDALLICSCTYQELFTNVMLSQTDIIGCNLYPVLTAETTFTVDDLIAGFYWGKDDIRYIDGLNALSEQYGKPILMTEIGTGCYSDGMYNTALAGTIYDEEAQVKFYQAVFETLGVMENVHGLCWFECLTETTDSFTFVDRPSEQIVQENWGQYNVN